MSVRVVLAPSVTRERFEDAAQVLRWTLHSVVADSPERPYEEIWAIDGGASAVHYIEDDTLSVAFLLVMGEHAHAHAHEIMRWIPTITPAGAVEMARTASGRDERVRAASYLAATAPPAGRPDVVDAFDELLSDEDAAVRGAALTAASYPGWPELRPLFERVAAADPNAAVQESARRVLAEIGS